MKNYIVNLKKKIKTLLIVMDMEYMDILTGKNMSSIYYRQDLLVRYSSSRSGGDGVKRADRGLLF